ncbi:MAG: RecQ family ATP-dependent DNA helicase, partial [Bacteroidota bacterium]
MTSKSKEVLKKYWNYDDFRPGQLEIIENILQKKDVLALLPTGGGKSICYQVPALVLDGLTLVVSPLIALMKDQVSQLNKRGIKAAAIYSSMHSRTIDITLDNAVYGSIKLLYVSPERLKTELFIERFKKMNINFIAIDESHCISQWGYDFRPAYLEIDKIRKIKTNIPVAAFTATATKAVIEDIQEKLSFPKANVIRQSFHRKNLSFTVIKSDHKEP